jgi:hypothetical protein
MAQRSIKTITDFKAKLQGGAARPNLFEVSIPTFPDAVKDGWDDETFNFLCKSAALPASNIAPIDVPFRGRILKVAGDRTFDTWTVTVINDEDFKLRSSFERWMNMMNKLDNSTGATNPGSYMVDAYVHQLGRGDKRFSANNSSNPTVNSLRTYKFYSIFPTNVSQIDLSYDTSDTIEEYTVEFQVQWWQAMGDDQTGIEIS